MTSSEWHEADQDDADRVRAWPAQDAQEPMPGAEREEGFWFLDDENRRLMEQLRLTTASRLRLATGNEYLRSEIANLKAEIDKQDAEISLLTQALSEVHR